MKLTICSRSIYRNECWAIHKEGCSDIARSEVSKYGASTTGFEGSVESALAQVLDDEMKEMGYGREHVKVYPCCK